MEENKKKKKKLTLSISSKTHHNVSHYTKSRGKTSVVIEKKAPRRWNDKNFKSRSNETAKIKSTGNFDNKNIPPSKNFNLRNGTR